MEETRINRFRAIMGAMVAAVFVLAPFSANAQTNAGTVVSNTFTLDYQVGGTDQPQITPPASTTFTVDRIVNLAVSNPLDGTVAPGAVTDVANAPERVVFAIQNTGNDRQAYSLAVTNVAGDDFDVSSIGATLFTDTNGNGVFDAGEDTGGISYDLGAAGPTADLDPDATVFVVITGTIPGTVTNGNTSDVLLVADSLNPADSLDNASDADAAFVAGDPAVTETGNTLDGRAQTFLADATGEGHGANDGAESARGTFVVASAQLSAQKLVFVVATEPTDCANQATPAAPNDELAVPGACVEYVIEVTNDAGASVDATAINVTDTLPGEITFVSSSIAGGFTAGSITTEPAPGCTAPTTCDVIFTGGTLPPGGVGEVIIRATVN